MEIATNQQVTTMVEPGHHLPRILFNCMPNAYSVKSSHYLCMKCPAPDQKEVSGLLLELLKVAPGTILLALLSFIPTNYVIQRYGLFLTGPPTH